ncbi:MAG: GNAT family N-acetyltransferase [Ignavibacteria bacterium]|nr:GNAT family N-acetyltransferase [Ignavibacteria bacterium]
MKKQIGDNYFISNDKTLLDVNTIHGFLSNSYWNKGIPFELVQKSIENSFCFGVYCNEKQIKFARVVTDFAINAYLADVFILEKHRGKGLSKQLMNFIFEHPQLQNIKAWRLVTADAHGLYTKYGFKAPEFPERVMERKTKIW